MAGNMGRAPSKPSKMHNFEDLACVTHAKVVFACLSCSAGATNTDILSHDHCPPRVLSVLLGFIAHLEVPESQPAS